MVICNQVMAWMAKAATIVARRQAQLSVAVSAAAENEKLLQHAGEKRGGGGRSSGATLRHLFAYGGEAEREADALQLAAVRVVEVDPITLDPTLSLGLTPLLSRCAWSRWTRATSSQPRASVTASP